MENKESTVPCKYCGEPTLMLGTKLCDNCWEIKKRTELNPNLTRLILNDIKATFVVKEIIRDLTDRRGLRQEWDLIEPKIQGEIKNCWIKIIRKVF